MFKRLIAIANKPKRPIQIQMLCKILAFQALLLAVIVVVVTFWPERAFALGPLVFLALGIAVAVSIST